MQIFSLAAKLVLPGGRRWRCRQQEKIGSSRSQSNWYFLDPDDVVQRSTDEPVFGFTSELAGARRQCLPMMSRWAGNGEQTSGLIQSALVGQRGRGR